jgi:hypothetical protein
MTKDIIYQCNNDFSNINTGNTLPEIFKINIKREETVMGLKKIIKEEQNLTIFQAVES